MRSLRIVAETKRLASQWDALLEVAMNLKHVAEFSWSTWLRGLE